MSKDYNAETPLPVVTAGSTYQTRNPVVPGVRRAYSRIHTRGDYLRAWDGVGDPLIPGMRYTANKQNELGVGNHFQGVQRLRVGKYLVVSGGDQHGEEDLGPASHVFVVKMDSRPARGPWGSNLIHLRKPPAGDALVRVIGLDRDLWHAGGMSVCGDILAVPVESSMGPGFQRSKVVLLNMNDPEQPERFPNDVVRKKAKAGAVALTRLDNDFYLLGVWSDSDTNPKKPRRIDFYLSKTTTLLDGFRSAFVTWYATDVEAADGQDANFSNFQTINFVWQDDGRLFLIGLHNTSEAAPTVPGRDYADLYTVTLPDSLLADAPTLDIPVITKIGKRQFFCDDQQANMDGAAGVYVDAGGRLHVYATWHWRSDNELRFNEFRYEPPGNNPPITSIQDAWVDLYENDRFQGRRLSILGKRDSAIRNFGDIQVQGSGFDDKVSSVRFQIPAGTDYVLFADRNYSGDALHLHGTGSVVEIRNLNREFGFGDKVSSARYP